MLARIYADQRLKQRPYGIHFFFFGRSFKINVGLDGVDRLTIEQKLVAEHAVSFFIQLARGRGQAVDIILFHLGECYIRIHCVEKRRDVLLAYDGDEEIEMHLAAETYGLK